MVRGTEQQKAALRIERLRVRWSSPWSATSAIRWSVASAERVCDGHEDGLTVALEARDLVEVQYTSGAPSKLFIAAHRRVSTWGLGCPGGRGSAGRASDLEDVAVRVGGSPDVGEARIGRAHLRRSRAAIVRRRLAGVVSVLALGVGAGAGVDVDVGAGAVSAAPAAAPLITTALRAPAGTPMVTVGRDVPVNPIAPGFLGLSMEYTALLPYAGHNGIDPVFLRLIRQLNPGQSPVSRIGGDSTDWSWVPVPARVKPPGVIYTVRRRWLTALRGLVQALNAHVIFGVNLEANSSAVAAAEARAVIGAIGRSSVQAVELGNEPEVYGVLGWYAHARTAVTGRPASYDVASYRANFAQIARALGDLPLAGPATGSAGGMRGLPV